MSLENRMECLRNLKKLGFQTGCGIMTGSPFQSAESLAQDMLFMESLQPEMVGIGPFIPHKDTPFAKFPAGTLESTLMAVSLCRIMLEKSLLPSTTALGALQCNGRELGILAGANVIMPNLTPPDAQDNYILYENKKRADVPVLQAVADLQSRLDVIGYTFYTGRGDFGV
jgi:biotin synthase